MKKQGKTPCRDTVIMPAVKEVEATIGLKAIKWKNRCHEIACKMLEAGLVVGVERYGHYRGPISIRHPRYGLPFQPHGWIETPRGLVIDPTRWCFRMVKPYIAYCPGLDYDAGGQRFHTELNGPYPVGSPRDSPGMVAAQRIMRRKIIPLVMPVAAMKQLAVHTNGQDENFTFDQLYWIAHAPLPWWGEHARAIYQAIADAGCKALIPFDYWRMVMDQPMASNLP